MKPEDELILLRSSLSETKSAEMARNCPIVLPQSPFRTKRPNLLHITAVTFLCAVFYVVGLWQHSGTAVTFPSSREASPTCGSQPRAHNATGQSNPAVLDFTPHHRAEDLVAAEERVVHFPPCPSNFSEYTPCEDVKRSLRFDRDRFVLLSIHQQRDIDRSLSIPLLKA